MSVFDLVRLKKVLQLFSNLIFDILSGTVDNLRIMSISLSKSSHRVENITEIFRIVDFLIMVSSTMGE